MGTINSRLVKIAAGLSMALLIVLSFLGNADKIGQEYTDTAFQRALITFASARAINGLISVAQGTEVAIQPGGIGTVLTPGEIKSSLLNTRRASKKSQICSESSPSSGNTSKPHALNYMI